MIHTILEAYGIDKTNSLVLPLPDGLINKTWKIIDGNREFILQRINDAVFSRPHELAKNLQMIGRYLTEHYPEEVFASPLSNRKQEDLLHIPGQGYFRLFPFIQGSHTIPVVNSPDEAFEAAAQFGKFTNHLRGFDASRLHITIPGFHNLTLRYQQFEKAIAEGNAVRIKKSKQLIAEVLNHRFILDRYEKIIRSTDIEKRVAHHDTKISNVLLDTHGKGICVIDLDTVMPGYFISDFGDMMRTYLPAAGEEEKDLSKIEVREDVFKAIVQGYLSFMGGELTRTELDLIFYSGLFLTYMQAIRFLTDYCNDDVYYGASYEDHNFSRAGNQIALLKKFQEKAAILKRVVKNEIITRYDSAK